MVVVADTTPVNYLILIGEIDVLASLYGRVVVPGAVYEELQNPLAPLMVRTWIAQSWEWFEVRAAPEMFDDELSKLDRGERDAIALAKELAADHLIIDEVRGRRLAERRGLSVIGTLGVLRDAAGAGLLDLASAIERLRNTSFHISPEILMRLLKDLA